MRAAYVPDLSSLQLLGELNFRRICRLIRTQEECDEWHFVVPTTGMIESRLTLEIINRSRYTTQLSFTFGQGVFNQSSVDQNAFIKRKAPDLLFDHNVTMTVCLYHDVNIAEITNGHRQYKGVYPYPNDDMLHKDEKIRLNQQLADLLELCLKHGHRQNQKPSYHLA